MIYKITNVENGKIYIGQTTQGIDKRINQYLLGNHNVSKSIIGNSIKKHGLRMFIVEIIDFAKCIEELNELEIFWINFFNTISPVGYNLRGGGGGGGPLHESTKEKIRQSKIGKPGRKLTDADKDRISKMHKGKVVGEATRDKLRKANIGKLLSEETKAKVAEKSKLYRHSDKSRGKISLSNIGKMHSEQTKCKMSSSAKFKTPRNKTGYKGVYMASDGYSWQVSHKIGKKSKQIGRFKDIIEAAIAYDEYVFKLYGFECYLNFPWRFLQDDK